MDGYSYKVCWIQLPLEIQENILFFACLQLCCVADAFSSREQGPEARPFVFI